MIDAQSIVVASTVTNWFGHEGSILRYVFLHSIALACLVSVLVMLQADVFPGMMVRWREVDSNPSVPREAPDIGAFKQICSAPVCGCRACSL